jgi:hypothetical protein
MNLKHSLETYFQYHPPTTQKRKDLHERVNKESLRMFKVLIDSAGNSVDLKFLYSFWRVFVEDICSDPTCQNWAKDSLDRAWRAAIEMPIDYEEKIFMHIQQVRMFLNQGVTIQEIDA